MSGTCQPGWCSSRNETTHPLRVKRGRNVSAMIVRLVGCKYTPPDKRKWREHVSHYGAAHEMGIITHCLRVESGGKMSAMIVLLMEYKYALPNNRKWWEQVSRDYGAAHRIGLCTRWESRATGTCQPWLCCSWNINTHFLIIEMVGTSQSYYGAA